jgi:hypothetical protein
MTTIKKLIKKNEEYSILIFRKDKTRKKKQTNRSL